MKNLFVETVQFEAAFCKALLTTIFRFALVVGTIYAITH